MFGVFFKAETVGKGWEEEHNRCGSGKAAQTEYT